MSFDIDKQDGVVVIHLNVPRLDANTSRQLKRLIEEQTVQPDDRLVLDFDGVDFIDSSGLGMLVKLMKHLGLSGGLVLCCIHSKPIMDILVMTRMNKAFTIKDNLKEALSAFQ